MLSTRLLGFFKKRWAQSLKNYLKQSGHQQLKNLEVDDFNRQQNSSHLLKPCSQQRLEEHQDLGKLQDPFPKILFSFTAKEKFFNQSIYFLVLAFITWQDHVKLSTLLTSLDTVLTTIPYLISKPRKQNLSKKKLLRAASCPYNQKIINQFTHIFGSIILTSKLTSKLVADLQVQRTLWPSRTVVKEFMLKEIHHQSSRNEIAKYFWRI